MVHRDGLQHRGVHVFLFAPHGRLIVQQRSRDRETSPLSLDCSVSEHVRAGEDFLQAAVRGLNEELGVDGIDLQPVITFKMQYGPNDNEISRLYEGTLDPARIEFDPVEVERVMEYDLSELLELTRGGKIAVSYWLKQLIFWAMGGPAELHILEVHAQPRYGHFAIP